MATDLSLLQDWVRSDYELARAVHQLLTGGEYSAVDGKIHGGSKPTTTSTYRSTQEQERLYAERASNPYPVNRPGDSAHQWGMAVDSDVPDREQPLWRAVREWVGFRVPSNDEVHGEVPNWRDIVRQAGY